MAWVPPSLGDADSLSPLPQSSLEVYSSVEGPKHGCKTGVGVCILHGNLGWHHFPGSRPRTEPQRL